MIYLFGRIDKSLIEYYSINKTSFRVNKAEASELVYNIRRAGLSP
jgi:hypothetical protein